MTEPKKRAPTTISRAKYLDLQRQCIELGRKEAAALQRVSDLRAERDQLAKEVDAAKKEVDSARASMLKAVERAAIAEGYAEALASAQFPPRPPMPWSEPKNDQWGNRIY